VSNDGGPVNVGGREWFSSAWTTASDEEWWAVTDAAYGRERRSFTRVLNGRPEIRWEPWGEWGSSGGEWGDLDELKVFGGGEW
jgi:hypothetical protein